MEEDILFLERLLNEDPSPPPPMIPNQKKSSIKKPEHSFSMGYEHFNTTLVTNEVAESSTKNLVPIPRECEVTSDNESESIEPFKDDSLIFKTFPNPLINDKDDVIIHVEDVPIEESKVPSNPLFDNDEINSDELESHEERIRREHADYINRMEMLFTINLRPRSTMNVNTNVESLPSLHIPVQDNDSQREEINIVTSMDELLPPGVENNDDSDGEVDVVLHVDNSISNSEHELSDNESSESDFDNPSIPRPLSEPPDVKFEPDSGAEI
nr:hypothetical protein [Tanacetum cinerariifolium]GFA74317.1 hypothetical protein [Tanacetum cinerariifolium]